MRRFINEKKGKEWTIEIVDAADGTKEVRTRSGKIGEQGVLGTRGVPTAEAAEKKAAELIAQQLKKGYVETEAPAENGSADESGEKQEN